MKGAIAVLLLAVLHTAMTNAAVNPKTFFPDVKNNLTKIVWAHAVNSQKDLTNALENPSVMMLEADVVMGVKNDSKDNNSIPIMSHSHNTSDLTLEEFVAAVNNKKKTVGVKFDFKTIDAFVASNKTLKSLNENATYPVFINADIYPGPVDAEKTNIDAEAFMKEALQYKNFTLSLGWTTKNKGGNNATQTTGYTDDQVNKMIEMLKAKNVSQPITYAVRASLAAVSMAQMEKLVNNTDVKDTTLTIWSHEDDAVNATELSKLINSVQHKNVYLDVPDALKSKLTLNGASGITVTTMTMLGSLLVNYFLTAMPRRG